MGRFQPIRLTRNASMHQWKIVFPAGWIRGVHSSPDVQILEAFWSKRDRKVSARPRDRDKMILNEINCSCSLATRSL